MRTSAKKNPNAELLTAGGRDFLKASAAIARFGGLVYEYGKKVLERRASEIKESTGLQPDVKKILTYPQSDYVNDEHDGTEAMIGAYMPLSSSKLSLCVWWRTTADATETCSAAATIECKSVRTAEALYDSLRTVAQGRIRWESSNRYELYIEKTLKPEEFVDLDKHFDTLTEEWIRFAKRIGGFRAIPK